MSDITRIILKHGEDKRLRAGHCWIFSNEIDTKESPLKGLEPGEPALFFDSRKRLLGSGYINPASLIAGRILSRNTAFAEDDKRDKLLKDRLIAALELRKALYPTPHYRMVYGESDGLPGLVIDRFGDIVVVQISTWGMEVLRGDICKAVEKVVQPSAIWLKNDGGSRDLENLPKYSEMALGEMPSELHVSEAGLDLVAAGEHLQKTGWFYDQADNRRKLERYVTEGASVLDLYSYAGAWGVAARKFGAAEAVCVDVSSTATAMAEANGERNGLPVQTITGDCFDVLESLKNEQRSFDVVIVDPPAFIKRKKDLKKGAAAYQSVNEQAMLRVKQGGFFVSASCSYHLPEKELQQIIRRAAKNIGRQVQILERGGQGPDHPVHPAIPETHYLQAFLCRVN